MGQEIDLLVNYPKTKRNLEERLAAKNETRLVGGGDGTHVVDLGLNLFNGVAGLHVKGDGSAH